LSIFILRIIQVKAVDTFSQWPQCRWKACSFKHCLNIFRKHSAMPH